MAVKFELPFTQTSHVVAFVCALLLAVVLSPVGNIQLSKGEIVADLVRLIHLSSFATWLGVQVWVTFFAGIAFKYFVGSFFFCTTSDRKLGVGLGSRLMHGYCETSGCPTSLASRTRFYKGKDLVNCLYTPATLYSVVQSHCSGLSHDKLHHSSSSVEKLWRKRASQDVFSTTAETVKKKNSATGNSRVLYLKY